MSTKRRETANDGNTFVYHALGDGLWLEIDTDGDTNTVSDAMLNTYWRGDTANMLELGSGYYNAMRYYPAPEKQEQYTPAAAIGAKEKSVVIALAMGAKIITPFDDRSLARWAVLRNGALFYLSGYFNPGDLSGDPDKHTSEIYNFYNPGAYVDAPVLWWHVLGWALNRQWYSDSKTQASGITQLYRCLTVGAKNFTIDKAAAIWLDAIYELVMEQHKE